VGEGTAQAADEGELIDMHPHPALRATLSHGERGKDDKHKLNKYKGRPY